MLMLKIFITVIAIIVLAFIFLNYLKKDGENEKKNCRDSERDMETIENLAEQTEKKKYISFRLIGVKMPRIWEFELTPKVTIIGRGTEKFKNDKSIREDRAFSREHLAFFRDKDGVVHFMAIKGERNPVYVFEKDCGGEVRTKIENGNFYLEPNKAHRIRMGNTEMEVFYKGVPVSKFERNNHKNGTQVYETPGCRARTNKRPGTRIFRGVS